MNEVHRTEIPPVPAGEARPQWSVMIPTHNCAAYLRETLQSVLAQDPGPERMQIEVVDDGSTADDPEAVVRELGGGRVSFYRQPRNVGHVRNFETCLLRSRGHLVHLLHGDDGVLPGFYEAMQRPFLRHPEIGAAFCRYVFMDEDGHWFRISALERGESGVLENWAQNLVVHQRIQTPSMVVRRAVYERLGGFDRRLTWTEDWEMWVRIAARYPVWYETEPLAAYRVHSASSSGRRTRTGENVQDMKRAVEINRTHLPPDASEQLYRFARNWCAREAIKTARQAWSSGDTRTAWVQVREAWRSFPSLHTLTQTMRFALWTMTQPGGAIPWSTGRGSRRSARANSLHDPEPRGKQ